MYCTICSYVGVYNIIITKLNKNGFILEIPKNIYPNSLSNHLPSRACKNQLKIHLLDVYLE